MTEDFEGELVEAVALTDYSQQSSLTVKNQFFTAQVVPRERDFARSSGLAVREAKRLGDDGYYRWKVGKSLVFDGTIGLALAAARSWGNIISNVVIDKQERDKVYLTAFCADLESGFNQSRPGCYGITPAPGKFKNSPEERLRWENMQIQVAVSKAQRDIIKRTVPAWLWRDMLDASYEAARNSVLKDRHGREITPDEAKKSIVEGFSRRNVNLKDLETYLGRAHPVWQVQDLLELKSLMRSIGRGEITIAEVFPEDQVSAQGTFDDAMKAKTKASDFPPKHTDPAPGPKAPRPTPGSQPAEVEQSEDHETLIIEFLERKGGTPQSTVEAAAATKMSIASCRTKLLELAEEGTVYRHGVGRGTKWALFPEVEDRSEPGEDAPDSSEEAEAEMRKSMNQEAETEEYDGP